MLAHGPVVYREQLDEMSSMLSMQEVVRATVITVLFPDRHAKEVYPGIAVRVA